MTAHWSTFAATRFYDCLPALRLPSPLEHCPPPLDQPLLPRQPGATPALARREQ